VMRFMRNRCCRLVRDARARARAPAAPPPPPSPRTHDSQTTLNCSSSISSPLCAPPEELLGGVAAAVWSLARSAPRDTLSRGWNSESAASRGSIPDTALFTRRGIHMCTQLQTRACPGKRKGFCQKHRVWDLPAWPHGDLGLDG
jgi:hypothetical protein